jgi:hypothetical protein
MSLADIVAKLPLDVQRIIARFLRTPAAECIADGRPRYVSRYTDFDSTWTWLGYWLYDPDEMEYYRLEYHRHLGYWFGKAEVVVYQGGHISWRLMDQARDRAYSFSKLTPRNEAIWLRGQLALNDIHPPVNTHKKTMWKIFMAL